MSEFALIERIRSRCVHARSDVALGIGDDAALLQPPPGKHIVACTDTLVAGVHFPAGTDPADLGWKALAVNLSDLAAMGAEPAWALLALTLPDGDAAFVDGFAAGFAELAHAHGVALVGGDTTQGPLSVTVTALGWVDAGAALTRAGARVGDGVYVTGTLGDAAAALWGLQHDRLELAAGLRRHLDRPEPRVAAGRALRGLASACIDVSDGLLADLGHVCEASGVGAEIDASALPLSDAITAAFTRALCRDFALTGGDDYELCLTLPPAREAQLAAITAKADCRITRIGRIVGGTGVRVLDADGKPVATGTSGWEHFSR